MGKKPFNIQYRSSERAMNIQYYSMFNKDDAKRNRKSQTEEGARRKADYLATKLKNTEGIRFYLKCAWNLTDEYLDWLADYSQKKDNPAKYFSFCASKMMR